jgi:hypothetical protein
MLFECFEFLTHLYQSRIELQTNFIIIEQCALQDKTAQQSAKQLKGKTAIICDASVVQDYAFSGTLLLDQPNVSNCALSGMSRHRTGSICPSVSRTLRASALSPNGFCKKAVRSSWMPCRNTASSV